MDRKEKIHPMFVEILTRLSEPYGTLHEAECRQCSVSFWSADATAGLCMECRGAIEGFELVEE